MTKCQPATDSQVVSHFCKPLYNEWRKFLILKEILGHSDINMTMICANFAPTQLEDAITQSPLNGLAK